MTYKYKFSDRENILKKRNSLIKSKIKYSVIVDYKLNLILFLTI